MDDFVRDDLDVTGHLANLNPVLMALKPQAILLLLQKQVWAGLGTGRGQGRGKGKGQKWGQDEVLTWMTRVSGSPGWWRIQRSRRAVENCGSGR